MLAVLRAAKASSGVGKAVSGAPRGGGPRGGAEGRAAGGEELLAALADDDDNEERPGDLAVGAALDTDSAEADTATSDSDAAPSALEEERARLRSKPFTVNVHVQWIKTGVKRQS